VRAVLVERYRVHVPHDFAGYLARWLRVAVASLDLGSARVFGRP